MVFYPTMATCQSRMTGEIGLPLVIREPLLQDGSLTSTFGSSLRGAGGEPDALSPGTHAVTDLRSSSYLEVCISSDRASQLGRSRYRAFNLSIHATLVQPLEQQLGCLIGIL